MAEKHLNPGPSAPARVAVGNVIPFRVSPSPVQPSVPPSLHICSEPLFVCTQVKIANLLCALQSGGLCLRFDRPSGRFVIDDKPNPS
jgi:hypothetical protein